MGAERATQAALEAQAIEHWERLYTHARFRLRYPSESVVRFLAKGFPEEARSSAKVLDIGLGSGRHVKLLCDLGFRAFGVDLSTEGLRHCRDWLAGADQNAELYQASMFKLPLPDGSMDATISFGVFYYADAAGMRRAIAEMHRVLRPSGLAFVYTRTDADYRYGKGICLEPHTFRLEIDDTSERGCVMHFLREGDVADMFRAFSEVRFEKTETTFADRKAVNSDWLIEVRK
jgi:SAM-dependent methyltransferase